MSQMARQRHEGTSRPARYRALQPVMLLWLTVVWMAFWRDFSIGNIVVGFTLAVIVSLVFPLPPLQMETRVRPLHLVWLVVRFLYDVVVASFQVVWLTLQFRRQPESSVIAVTLRTQSDFVMTLVSQMTSLVPGTIVVEAQRQTNTVYVHSLDVRDTTVEEIRGHVLAQERRIALALGMDVDEPLPQTPGGPR